MAGESPSPPILPPLPLRERAGVRGKKVKESEHQATPAIPGWTETPHAPA